MKPIAIIAGAIAGVIGAVIWAAVAYYVNFEIGYIAWGIGGLVGLAMALTAKESSMALGVAAVIISVVSICGGKYAAISIAVDDYMKEMNMAGLIDDDLMISNFADDVIVEYEETGRSVVLPQPVGEEEIPYVEYYPSEIWGEATNRWQAIPVEEREEMKAEARRTLAADIGMYREKIREEAFKASFGAFDILFFGLAIVTAYRIAGTATVTES